MHLARRQISRGSTGHIEMSDDAAADRKESVAEFFGALAAPGFGLEDEMFLSMGQRLVRFADVGLNQRVLDVAAGRGANLFAAISEVGERGSVLGIDLAEPMVRNTNAEISKRGLKNASMTKMDAEHLEFRDASFDRVLCGFALFFFPRPENALAEILRVLRPGGVFGATSFAAEGYPWRWYGELLSTHKISSRLDEVLGLCSPSLFTPEGLERAFSCAGFVDTCVAVAVHDDIYRDEEAWWNRVQLSADRNLFRGLSPAHLKAFKADAFRWLSAQKGEDGIRMRYRLLLAKGSKPAE